MPDRVASTVGGGHAFSVVPGVSGSPGTCDTATTGLRSSAGGGEGQVVCRQTFSDSVESSNVFFVISHICCVVLYFTDVLLLQLTFLCVYIVLCFVL